MTGVEAYRRAPPTNNSKVSNTRLRQQQAPVPQQDAGLNRLKTERGALITSSLPSLQNLIKRSPESYAEEFSAQWARFGSLVKIVQLGLGGTKADEDKLREVTGFICQVSIHTPKPRSVPRTVTLTRHLVQVAHLYPTITGSLPGTLSSLLLASASAATASNATTTSATTSGTGVAGGGVQLTPETRKTMMQGLVLLRRRDVITGVE